MRNSDVRRPRDDGTGGDECKVGHLKRIVFVFDVVVVVVVVVEIVAIVFFSIGAIRRRAK